MAIQLICRKLGMTQIFESTGECIPVTVLQADSNTIVQKKSDEKEGYTALQVGAIPSRPSRTNRPRQGHFDKAGVAPQRALHECRISSEEAEAYEVGQQLGVDLFEAGQRVDVIGTSKGRGTAGVVKRHGFAIKRRTHGTHEYFRHPGAIGAGAYPGRVLKGTKMPGRFGNERVTVLDLEIVRIEQEKGLLFVRGAVPGHAEGLVHVRASVKARG
ncbi:50S ribosomal protein L3 [Myxococcota bacterium]|nr:50S ribosomal protein L3 [Myxococcota bacterium]